MSTQACIFFVIGIIIEKKTIDDASRRKANHFYYTSSSCCGKIISILRLLWHWQMMEFVLLTFDEFAGSPGSQWLLQNTNCKYHALVGLNRNSLSFFSCKSFFFFYFCPPIIILFTCISSVCALFFDFLYILLQLILWN